MSLAGLSRRDGFALPLTVFVLTLITIMLAGIMVQVQVDRRIAESSGDVVDALAIAQSGLDRYMTHYDTMPNRPPDGDSLRINVTGGYADVIAHVAQRPADSLQGITYVVRSSGWLIRPTQGSDPQATRTVAQYAEWQYGTMKVIAALTAINDFKTGSGTLFFSGFDQCVPALPTVPGLRVPQGATPNPLGPPDVIPFKVEIGNASDVADATDIDWTSVITGNWNPDYTTLVNPLTWATYWISGDVTLTDVTGTGLLVVGGELTTAGLLFDWQGAVLVGNKFTFLADTTRIHGAAVSGLNQITGPSPTNGDWGPAGTHIEIEYYSCFVRQAFVPFSGFAPIPNGWMDNWAAY
jgi:hypothetical protein